MASFSKVTESKRSRRNKNAGKARKAKLARKSTASYSELFGPLGEPGAAAPKAAPTKQAAAPAAKA
ncbi:MAG: hypothetical protein H0T76_17260 [Nannocystis sp.]|nr:hypothetical protein [Nannocystis sp.]MBA3548234.1 hypothetical protein [Nannocystis sp.]